MPDSGEQAAPARLSIPNRGLRCDPKEVIKPPQNGAFSQPATGGSRRRYGACTKKAVQTRVPTPGWSSAGCRHLLPRRPGTLAVSPMQRCGLRRLLCTTSSRIASGGHVGVAARQAPHDKAKTLHRMPGCELVHAAQDLRPKVGQLLRPHRRGAEHREPAAAKRVRPRAGGHGRAGGARPCGVRARLIASFDSGDAALQHLAEAPRQITCRRSVLSPARTHSASSAGGGATALSVIGGGATASVPPMGTSTTVPVASSPSVK